MPLLEVRNLSVRYAGISAVKSVSITVNEAEVVVLIGANGAGKSSLLRAIFSLVPCTAEALRINGVDYRNKSTWDRVIAGVSLVPETRDLFPGMTVEDNLKLGLLIRKAEKLFSGELDRICGIFPMLKSRLKQLAGSLSGGEQQMLALGRALMQAPKLLCLDEPSLGLAPKIVDDLYSMLGGIRNSGISLLLVEQQARRALDFGDRGYVMNVGDIILDGSCLILKDDKYVQGAYMGLK